MSHKKRGDCPKSEDFVHAFLEETGDLTRQEFLDHVARCPSCRPRMRALTDVKTELERRKDLVPEAGLTREEARALRKVALAEMRRLKPPARPLSLRPLPVAAVAVIAVIALALGYLYLDNTLHSRFAVRGAINQELRLLGPGPHLRGAPADFSWSDVPGRDDFRFILADDELNTIYEIESEATGLRLPENVRAKLVRGRTYLWTVLALDDNGRELASASRVFKFE
jgi:hypothetical protein